MIALIKTCVSYSKRSMYAYVKKKNAASKTYPVVHPCMHMTFTGHAHKQKHALRWQEWRKLTMRKENWKGCYLLCYDQRNHQHRRRRCHHLCHHFHFHRFHHLHFLDLQVPNWPCLLGRKEPILVRPSPWRSDTRRCWQSGAQKPYMQQVGNGVQPERCCVTACRSKTSLRVTPAGCKRRRLRAANSHRPFPSPFSSSLFLSLHFTVFKMGPTLIHKKF